MNDALKAEEVELAGSPPSGAPAGTRRGRRESDVLPLAMPVIGMEAEFNVVVDGAEAEPLQYWDHPNAFIEQELLPRTKKSSHLPTGGAVYFDTGVIEVVTPVIELAPSCTARVVRNLWEQIGFVRDELTSWEARSGHRVTLRGFSTHYNIAFDLPRNERASGRTLHELALLLAHILPIPVALVATNRRSTGVGVRPRGNRVEVTVDFTPDPGRMLAAAALIVGIAREVISWPSYDLSILETRGIPTVKGVVPGKHTSRRGWLTKDFHYPVNPFTCDVNAPVFETAEGRKLSLRAVAREVAWCFRKSIRKTSDPFSFRLLFSILAGRVPSLLELPDRPRAYEDVGRLCRWGEVIEELEGSSFPDGRLARSEYESVFLRLVSRVPFRVGRRIYRPVGMKGWYHAILRREPDGREVLLSLDDLLDLMARDRERLRAQSRMN